MTSGSVQEGIEPNAHAVTTAVDIRAPSHISLRVHHFISRGSLTRRTMFLSVPALLALSFPVAADQLLYQKPPKEVLDILNAPSLPGLSVNPTRTYATLSQGERYPPIAEVSEPMLRLAGIRIDPRTNGLHLAPHSVSIEIVKLP